MKRRVDINKITYEGTEMPQVTTTFLVRHGDIDNPKRIIYGQNIDLPLNDKGREQILNLAEAIQKMGYRPSKIFQVP